MGLISRKIFPACESMCVCCPASRSSSRQPVKRYKKSVLSQFSWRHSVAQKMTIFKLLLLVLVLFLVFSTESVAAQTDSYDELLLVLQWPASFCNTNNCHNLYHIPDKFTVHGLWLNKKSEPACCPGTGLPRQNIRLPEDMEKCWPNLRHQTNPEWFWAYEYEKHGSCHNIEPELYFQTALDIVHLIGDMGTMRFRSEKDLPQSEKALEMQHFYHVTDFEHVTIANRRVFPSLRCNYNHATRRVQLQEIVFCTDIRMDLQKCADNYNTCNRNNGIFYFPPVPASLSGFSRSPPSIATCNRPNGLFNFPPVQVSASSRSPPFVAWNDDQFCWPNAQNGVLHPGFHPNGGSPRMPAQNERFHYNGGSPRIP